MGYTQKALRCIFAGCMLLIATGTMAQDHEYLDLVLEDGSTLRYALVLPHHFDPQSEYPALLALPPGPQTKERVEAGLSRYWGREAAGRQWIVVSPIAPGERLFFQGSEKFIPQLLDAIQERFLIEGDKFHLAGVSNGGRSAFRVALNWPERFHDLIVLPGFPPNGRDFSRLDRLQGIPIYMFAGGKDKKWVAEEERTAEELKKLDIEAHLEVFPGEGHVPASMDGERLMDLLETLRPASPVAAQSASESAPVPAQPSAPPKVGPARGHLVIVGGGMDDPVILETFMNLAGGPDAPLVVIPTALEGDLTEDLDRFALPFREGGFTDVVVLHTRDPKIADTDAFLAPLLRASAVWFGGGRQWRLVDAYLDTLTEQAFHQVLARGGVIGGSSAGATIQGSYLVRGAPEGNAIMMAPGHERGFGFLRGVAIDQHVISRERENDMVPVIEAHPELLGLGIDENTALVVQGDRARVIGASQVLVYGNERLQAREDPPWLSLSPGDRFDLATRRQQ
ncbi:MAG: hypothetical protein E2P03_10105 [Acidobacteria bacterium]|nr:MAG: hypothetical protein E2P03_10105 [Acidobacteriota bacterium]